MTQGSLRELLGKDYLTPTEVATLFRVDPKTVTRWAKAGKLPFIMTLGGHRRYPADRIQELILRSQVREAVES